MAGDDRLVLSVDELRALGRLTGAALPPVLIEAAQDAGHDDVSDDDRVDRAALRGLLARGLVDLAGSTIAPGRALRPLAAALLAPALIAEIEREEGAQLVRSVVLEGAPRAVGTTGAFVLTESAPGIWTVRPAIRDARTTAGELAAVEHLGGPPGAGEPFELGAGAHRAADERLLDGDVEGAATVLGAAGLREPAARAWSAAVAGRRASVALRVTRATAPGPDGVGDAVLSDELCWLVDGDGGCWQVDLDGGDEEGPTVVTPVAGPTLARAVDALLVRPSPGEPGEAA